MLKVQLGCNVHLLPGFVNIDQLDIDHPDYLRWDLRNGLPQFKYPIVLCVSEHLFEHMKFSDGQKLMKACLNQMSSGAVFSMAVPNFRQLVEKYLANDWEFFAHVRHTAPHGMMMELVNDSIYQWVGDTHEHLQMWDSEYAIFQLKLAGFKDVKEVEFNPEYNRPERKNYTIYFSGLAP